MFVTDSFVFIHHFRHGGTFINYLLGRHFEGRWLGYHRPRSSMPEDLRSLPIIGFVRNPWDWYVSVYHHALNFNYPHGAGTFLNFVTRFRRLEFKEALWELFECRNAPPPRKREIEGLFPSSYDWTRPHRDNITRCDFVDWCRSGRGLHSWLFDRMFAIDGDPRDVIFGRFEVLRTDLVGVLRRVGVTTTSEFEAAVSREQRHNAMHGTNTLLGELPRPRRLDYRTYYDDALAARVAEEDRDLIAGFGYSF